MRAEGWTNRRIAPYVYDRSGWEKGASGLRVYAYPLSELVRIEWINGHRDFELELIGMLRGEIPPGSGFRRKATVTGAEFLPLLRAGDAPSWDRETPNFRTYRFSCAAMALVGLSEPVGCLPHDA